VTAVRALRLASLIEGASLLLLLCVAMPMKYALGIPLAVRVVGTAHGLLFLVLLRTAFRAGMERVVPTKTVLRVVGLSLLPFGCIAAERLLRRAVGPAAST
jgi:integral membrane protein